MLPPYSPINPTKTRARARRDVTYLAAGPAAFNKLLTKPGKTLLIAGVQLPVRPDAAQLAQR